MSIIPSSAVAAAFIPAQQATSELIRARNVQIQKDNHHHEEVDELDDTAVNSVNGQKQNKEKREGKGRKRPEGERVDIESLEGGAAQSAENASDSQGHLDISA
jgi:hypothetical protein